MIAAFAGVPALLALFLAREFGPIEFPPLDPATVVQVLMFYLPVAVVAIILMMPIRWPPTREASQHQSQGILLALLTFSAAYVVAALYDAIVLRQVLQYGISGARHIAIANGPRLSVVGAANALLSGAPAVLGALILTRAHFAKRLHTAAVVVVLLGLGCHLLTGGRNALVISMVFLAAVAAVKLASGAPTFLRSRSVLRLSLAATVCSATAVIGISMWMAIDRAMSKRASMTTAMQVFADDYKGTFTVPEGLSGPAEGLYYAYLQLSFYVSHPMVYLDEYFSQQYCPATGGAQSFDILFRIADYLFHTSAIKASTDALLLPGIYLTLPGTLYLDFCSLAPLAAVVIAALTGLALVAAVGMRLVASIPLAAFFLTSLALAPLYSVFTTGNGFSILLFAISLLLAPTTLPLFAKQSPGV